MVMTPGRSIGAYYRTKLDLICIKKQSNEASLHALIRKRVIRPFCKKFEEISLDYRIEYQGNGVHFIVVLLGDNAVEAASFVAKLWERKRLGRVLTVIPS